MDERKEALRGRFSRIIYRNEKTLFTVALFKPDKGSPRAVTVTGPVHDIQKDREYRLEGEYVTHPRYGMQFRFDACSALVPDDREGAILYLCGDSFPGIGRKTAERLLDDLGDGALEKIRRDPSVLDSLKYLNGRKRQSLREGASRMEDPAEKIFAYFSGYRFSARQIAQLARTYGQSAVEKMQENPYAASERIYGIGFAAADRMGMDLGFEMSDHRRIRALADSLLRQETMRTGSSYLPQEEFEELLRRKMAGLDYDPQDLAGDLERGGLAKQDEGRIYPMRQYEAECRIASFFRSFPLHPLEKVDSGRLEEEIEELEGRFSIRYASDQKKALEMFFSQDAMILTGRPGTGKTTIVRALMKLIGVFYPDASAALAAPTGRAAKRLKELTGYDARTLHSLLGFDLESGTFSKNEDNPLSEQILIVDEFSMVDADLFARVLEAGPLFRKILLIGDEDQLPSVGPGQVLKDLLESERIPCCRLEKIFRQEEGSGIVELAHQIARGDFVDFHWPDVKFLEEGPYQVVKAVKEVYLRALEAGYSPQDIQVIAPQYAGASGIDELNRVLQEAVNPPARGKREIRCGAVRYRQGDKILQLKNRPADQVYNGDIGILAGIEGDAMTVDYDGTFVEYARQDFDNVTHAFCVSVHKAQGSEYPLVIFPVCSQHRYMLERKLIYTGISRAKRELVLVGQAEAFRHGIRTIERKKRHTWLKERMKDDD